ncbi:hypothetical protein VSH64_34095 [Amycolatopsis rhabdoformis]|uniref:FXSXX-COOH protein n=1 Tax=Amycolatopsis rhabdoformis TaxID=1448059 RepID=A0ABZ1I243_9PSEU|nr:hypothetical protein [Amycolatopsis rhabdoformis]WSE27851.1 hypothetical protein VSH64_34095 [Amycolatopsis rhabdoformis]
MATQSVSRDRAAKICELRTLPVRLDDLDKHGLAEIAEPGLAACAQVPDTAPLRELLGFAVETNEPPETICRG